MAVEPLISARQVGQALRSERAALAEQIVARQYERRPDLVQRYGQAGRDKCLQDTSYHLQTLAAAVALSSPRLFTEYLGWAKAVLTAYRVDHRDIVENIGCMREVLAERVGGEFATVVDQLVGEGLHKLEAHTPPQELSGSTLDPVAERYLDALLNRDRAEATRIVMDAVQAGRTVRDLYLNVFAASQREVGRRWQLGQISVAQEHYCTAATQFVMSQLYADTLSLKSSRHSLVAAAVGEELHEIGLRMVADLFELDGWNTIYLGANLPRTSVINTIADVQPEVVALGATMSYHLLELAELVQALRADERCRNVRILVGGYPFALDPLLWHKVGADGGATDAQHAVRLANHLVRGRTARSADRSKILSLPSDGLSGNESKPASRAEDDLSRLNNEMATLQRNLTKANLQLRMLVDQNEAKNEELKQADRQKNEFLAVLGHELRGPLSAILHALEIQELAPDDLEAAAYARLVQRRQLDHMTRLINDLLDLSRIIHGKIELQREPVLLQTVIEQAIEMARPELDGKRHEFVVRMEEEPIWLDGDPVRLTQVVANLLTNAAKYTEPEGFITLSATRDRQLAVISVRDNGIGIDPDMLETIFGTFVQTSGPARPTGGLGIGLSLVDAIARLHGGTVQAFSVGLGHGSTFELRLPALDQPPPRSAERARESSAPAPAARSVLVVDDARSNTAITSRLLELLGHEVSIAHTGRAAIEQATVNPPDVVLLDLSLPDMEGIEVGRQLRGLAAGRGMRIVAVTGHEAAEYRQRATEAGFDDYLLKPVSLQALSRLLASAESIERASPRSSRPPE